MNLDNIVYYSTNTELAYRISQLFYMDKHFVWCSPCFDSGSVDKRNLMSRIPPSSNPYQIYLAFKRDVDEIDLHSAKIKENKMGLRRGALLQLQAGLIDETTFATINQMIETATISDFRPLIYIIPRALVEKKLRRVPVDQTANPFSVEFQILDLEKTEFEIIYI